MEENLRSEEQRNLDLTEQYLKKQLAALLEKHAKNRANLLSARKDMWEDTTSGIGDFDDVIALTQKDLEVNQENETYLDSSAKIDQLNSLMDSPYFGRMDFTDEEEMERETCYIGRYSVFDHKTFHHYIYDWRAPIASMYYDYDCGRAMYDTPGGKREGTIELKRQIKIEHGRISYVFDTDTTIQDQLLADALGEHTNHQLKVIISSIQREQNAAIRVENQKYLLIHGPAGSGKTSVGLHRMAYLLYHNRKQLNADNIMILSNNHIFNSYITNILPELGEEETKRDVFSSLITRYLPNELVKESFYDQAYALMCESHTSRIKSLKYLNSFVWIQFLEDFFTQYEFKAADVTLFGHVVITAQDLLKSASRQLGIKNYMVTRERIPQVIESEVNRYINLHKTELIDQMNTEHGNSLYDSECLVLLRKSANQCITEAVSYFYNMNDCSENTDSCTLYLRLVTQYIKGKLPNEEAVTMNEEIKERILTHQMAMEDSVSMLCIDLLCGKIAPIPAIRHVLLDEAQDYSIPALYFIRHLYRNSSFTILADLSQAVLPSISTNRYEDFNQIFDHRLKLCELNKSYRSTGPINRLAHALLAKEKPIEYIERDGDLPKMLITTDFAASIQTILAQADNQTATIGILTTTIEQANTLYSALYANQEIQLITSPKQEMSQRVIILPIMLAKGLEFDAVIAAGEFSELNQQVTSRNLLYLVCTRALHRLYLLNKGEVPKVL